MDKTKFEEIVRKKSENDLIKDLEGLEEVIRDYFDKHQDLNAHESGHSVRGMVLESLQVVVRLKKSEMLRKYEASTITKIMDELKSVQFLFDSKEQ